MKAELDISNMLSDKLFNVGDHSTLQLSVHFPT